MGYGLGSEDEEEVDFYSMIKHELEEDKKYYMGIKRND